MSTIRVFVLYWYDDQHEHEHHQGDCDNNDDGDQMMRLLLSVAVTSIVDDVRMFRSSYSTVMKVQENTD